MEPATKEELGSGEGSFFVHSRALPMWEPMCWPTVGMRSTPPSPPPFVQFVTDPFMCGLGVMG